MKKILSLILAVALVLCLPPSHVNAEAATASNNPEDNPEVAALFNQLNRIAMEKAIIEDSSSSLKLSKSNQDAIVNLYSKQEEGIELELSRYGIKKAKGTELDDMPTYGPLMLAM